MATTGRFTITSKFNEGFSYTGYSKQCEVMFRDYMNWCRKEKAPKAIQAEYNQNNDHTPEEVFELKVVEMTVEDFEKTTNKKVSKQKSAPKDFKVRKIENFLGNHNLVGEPVEKTPQSRIEFLKEFDFKPLFDEYMKGGKVKEICKREKLSTKEFYDGINEFRS
jgi:hypothetical protein